MARVLPKIPSSRLSPKRRVKRTEPALGLRLISLQPRLEPKELLEFEYRVQRVNAEDLERLEVSVIWQTEGKGTSELGVHYFKSLDGPELEAVLGRPHTVVTTLPAAPLSFSGELFSIRWCMRLRLFLNEGREYSVEREFILGQLGSDL